MRQEILIKTNHLFIYNITCHINHKTIYPMYDIPIIFKTSIWRNYLENIKYNIEMEYLFITILSRPVMAETFSRYNLNR